MSTRTFLGPIAGTVIALGGLATPLGQLPSQFVLAFAGVRDINGCLQYIQDETSSYSAACSPLTDVSGLPLLSNVIAFIAVFAVVWAIVDFFKKQSN